MKYNRNAIAKLLDDNQAVAGYGQKKSDYEVGFYVGTLEALRVAGFDVVKIRCGNGVVHVVNNPRKGVK